MQGRLLSDCAPPRKSVRYSQSMARKAQGERRRKRYMRMYSPRFVSFARYASRKTKPRVMPAEPENPVRTQYATRGDSATPSAELKATYRPWRW